jgi:hypothetical protein
VGSRWAWECGRPVFCAFVSRSRYREGQATLDIGPNEVRTEQPCCYVVRRISFFTGLMSVCVRGLVALYGTLSEARDKRARPLGRQVPVGPRERTGRKAGPGDGLRTVAWTPSVDGSVTTKLGSWTEGCKFAWASGPHTPRTEMLRPQRRWTDFGDSRASDQGEREVPGFGGRPTIRPEPTGGA